MDYIVYHIHLEDAVERELLSHQIGQLNVLGLEEIETGLLAYVEDHPQLNQELDCLLEEQNLRFEKTKLPEQNWNQLWESNFQPVYVSEQIQVRASFHEPQSGYAYDIQIDPKMSFGTGHHETTQMMMQSMLELDFKEKDVLDFGAGTGILSILAEKLGAKKVIAIDNDDWCIENIRENILLNSCSFIEFFKGESPKNLEPFDLILANINKNVLLEHAQLLTRLTKPGGFLILSGLLSTDYDDIDAVYRMYWNDLHQRKSINNWISITYANKKLS